MPGIFFMTCGLDSELDRTLFILSSACAEPFCQAFRYLRFRMVAPLDPSLFECRKNLVEEVALRAFLGLASIGALAAAPFLVLGGSAVLGIGHKLLRKAAYAFQKEGYTHVRGSAPEKTLGSELKVVTWNHCGPGGGMSLNHGGVVDWRYRAETLAAEIEREDPDVVVLQEYYDGAFSETMVRLLESKYAHFFYHLGQNTIGSESGLMLLSKAPVSNFSYTAFTNNDWTLNRGFATLEIKKSPESEASAFRIIGTHLRHGDADSDKALRMVQVAEIVESIQIQQTSLPTLLAGDLNIELGGEEGNILSPHFRHGYQGVEPTCTNHLVAKWDLEAKGTWGETIDYVSLYKDSAFDHLELLDGRLIKAFDDTYNTQTALSDHHGVALTIRGF